MGLTQTQWWRSLAYLVQLAGGFAGCAGAGVPVVGAAGAVAPAAHHQEAAGEEDGAGLLQLLAQVHREVSRRAAVALDILMQPVQVN